MDNVDANLTKHKEEETNELRSERGEADITDLNQMNKIVLKALEMRKEDIRMLASIKQDVQVAQIAGGPNMQLTSKAAEQDAITALNNVTVQDKANADQKAADTPLDHGEFCIKPSDNGEHAELAMVLTCIQSAG